MTLAVSWLLSQGVRGDAGCPYTQPSWSMLPLLHGKDDLMGRGSRGARFKLLDMLRERPCVKQPFNPFRACVCLNHPSKTGRNGSCCCQGKRVQRLKHRSGQTRGVINGHAHLPSAQLGAGHSPPPAPHTGALPCI